MISEEFPPPIFVLAAPGAPGPTLAAALGRNPAAYGTPEIALPMMATVDVFLREMSGPRAPQAHGVLRLLAQMLAGEQSGAAVEMARRWLDRRAYLPTSDAFRELAGRIAPRRLVAPATAAILDPPSLRRLLATFPEAAFVRLEAHPLSYGRLALASRGGRIALQLAGAIDEEADPPIPDPQDLWMRVETTLDTELAGLAADRVAPVRLEALLAAPEETLKALARKLGLQWNRKAVAAMGRPEVSPFAGPGPMGAHVNGQIESFAEIAAGLPDPSGDSLEAALPWRHDGYGLREAVAEQARRMGFT